MTRSLKSSTPAAPASGSTTSRRVTLYSDTTGQRKPVGSLNKGVAVRVEERTTAIVNNKPAEWVKVNSDSGSGWLPAAFLSGAN